MANTAAQTLFDDAECYACLDGATPFLILVIGQLVANLESAGTTMTPQEWMDEAACYDCLPGVSQAQAIIIAMLAAGGGGGGGSTNGQVMIYTAGSNPNADALVPTDPTKPAVAYSSDGSGSVYGWTTPAGPWA